jgi:hypothetical protein
MIESESDDLDMHGLSLGSSLAMHLEKLAVPMS